MKSSLNLPALAIVAVVFSITSCTTKNRELPSQNATAVQQFANVDASVKSQIASFLPDYFAVNQALIEDSLAWAKLAATAFGETVAKFQVSGLSGEQMDFYYIHSSNLKNGLKNLSESNDIEKARVELATVSEAMYALVKAFHPQETTLYYQYCPMARDNKGGTWLSQTKELVNPYMGQMMLECGRTQETIE